MSVTSEFYNFYKSLENNIESEVPSEESTSKVLNLIKKNLSTLSKLSSENLDKTDISFSKNGEIILDHLTAQETRKSFKKHIFNYSSYSQDTRRDLLKFTQFFNKYINAHMQEIDPQKILLLEKMVEQSITGLKDLQDHYRKDKNTTESSNVKSPIKKLNEALEALKEGEKLKNATPYQIINSQITLIRESDIGLPTQVLLLKNKLEAIRHPPHIFQKTTVEKNVEDRRLVQKTKYDLAKIDEEITILSHGGLANKDEDVTKRIKKLISLKEELQLDSRYIKAKESIAAFDVLLAEHEKNYSSIFEETPYKEYQFFVESLKEIYPNPEDRSYLLSNLILEKPMLKDLEKLQKKMKETSTDFLIQGQVRKLERSNVKKSHLFDGALELIKARKEKRIKDFEMEGEVEGAKWKLGRASANIIAIGGIATLSFFIPPTAGIGVALIPRMAKSAYKDLEDVWTEKTKKEKDIIAGELRGLLEEIRKDPVHVPIKIAKQYSENEEEGRKIIKFVGKMAELAKDRPHDLSTIIESIGEGLS